MDLVPLLSTRGGFMMLWCDDSHGHIVMMVLNGVDGVNGVMLG